jgi:predicted ester cyclase
VSDTAISLVYALLHGDNADIRERTTPDCHLCLGAAIPAPLSNLSITVERQVQSGSWMAIAIRVCANHPAANEPLDWCEHHAIHVDHNGLVTAWWRAGRLLRVAQTLAGVQVAPYKASGTWYSPLAGRAMTAASRIARPLGQPNTEVVRTYVEDFKNAQRFSVFPRVFAAGFRHHFDYEGDDGSMTSWVRTGQDFLRGVPDVQVELHALIADDDYVVEVNTARGTHTGPFRGIAATGRQISWTEIHIYRLKNGRIIENWPAVDVDAIVASLTKPSTDNLSHA